MYISGNTFFYKCIIYFLDNLDDFIEWTRLRKV